MLLFFTGIKAGMSANDLNQNKQEILRKADELRKRFVDGQAEFGRDFNVISGVEVIYNVKRAFLPNLDLANSLEKNKPLATDAIGKDRARVYHEIVERTKSGYTSTSKITIRFSKDKIVLKNAFEDPWNSGDIITQFFSSSSMVEVRDKEQIVKIFPATPTLALNSLWKFPEVFKGLGISFTSLRMLPEGADKCFYCMSNTLPVLLVFRVDDKGFLQEAQQIDPLLHVLQDATFKYNDNDSKWPKEIKLNLFNSQKKLIGTESWELISTKEAKSDDFNPEISKKYRIEDETSTNLPSDEISRMLQNN